MTTHFFLSQIRKEQDPEVQAILCQGVAKLVIAKMITDVEVCQFSTLDANSFSILSQAIKTLLKTYISPLTIGNDSLRQALDLFFKIYSFSSPENQQRMQEVISFIVLPDHIELIRSW